jgi:hypothetical protein
VVDEVSVGDPREDIALEAEVEPGLGPAVLLEIVKRLVKVLLADGS